MITLLLWWFDRRAFARYHRRAFLFEIEGGALMRADLRKPFARKILRMGSRLIGLDA